MNKIAAFLKAHPRAVRNTLLAGGVVVGLVLTTGAVLKLRDDAIVLEVAKS